MNKQPDSATDVDRLDQVLADYMEEAEGLQRQSLQVVRSSGEVR